MDAQDVIPLLSESDSGDCVAGDKRDVPDGENLRQSLDGADVEEGQFVSRTEVVEDALTDFSYLHEDVIKADATKVSGDVTAVFENSGLNDTDVEEGQLVDMETDENAVVSLSILHENSGLDGSVTDTNVKADNAPSENGCVTEMIGASTSGVKRTRTTFELQQPSVHVKYYGLSRESKQKLEELLREWSGWHARNLSRRQDEYGVSENGEEIYFPALDIGTGKNCAVTFWIENEVSNPEEKDFIHVEDTSVPLYDRGFALGSFSADGSSNLEGGSELLDAPRCFNCSSYSHSLKECRKPRDNDAVNSSRKQLKSKRNQTAGSRNPTRYYQDSPGGKYEGLRPGSLDAETRRLLGLGESDPPPWLNRMREIGYPPGYLEPEDENLPSGITIFSDEEVKEDKEDGEILETEFVDTPKKMSVKFPGINAPVPKNADEKDWEARPSNPDRHRNGDSGRSNHSSESNFRGRFREQNNKDFKDDDPLGYDRPSRYSSRYGDNDFNSTSRSLREDTYITRSDRGRNDRLDSEDSLAYRLYSSFSYGSSKRSSEHEDGGDGSKSDHPDYTPRSRDRDDRPRNRRER